MIDIGNNVNDDMKDSDNCNNYSDDNDGGSEGGSSGDK